MGKDEGDKMGMKRAKDFSEQLRKTCRILKERDFLMVCSNQIRVNTDQGGITVISPGGMAPGFYASVRLRTFSPTKIKLIKTIHGKEVTRIIGITVPIEVFKNSVWEPYRKVNVSILFKYGIDDLRQNLQFIKDHTSYKTYTLGGESVGKSMELAIKFIEEENLEEELKNEVIDLWHIIEEKFLIPRKLKQR